MLHPSIQIASGRSPFTSKHIQQCEELLVPGIRQAFKDGKVCAARCSELCQEPRGKSGSADIVTELQGNRNKLEYSMPRVILTTTRYAILSPTRQAALMGCANDSHTMKELLLQKGTLAQRLYICNVLSTCISNTMVRTVLTIVSFFPVLPGCSILSFRIR
jgi:hypothetical protein